MEINPVSSTILFKDSRHSNYGTTLLADMTVGYGSTNVTVTLPSKTGTLALVGEANATYRGTSINGTDTTGAIFSNSGVAKANVGDWYINTSTGNMYQCTVAGKASVAKWAYKDTQAILEGAQHVGAGIWADDVSNGCGAFLNKDGYLDLINMANYHCRISADMMADDGAIF